MITPGVNATEWEKSGDATLEFSTYGVIFANWDKILINSAVGPGARTEL